MQAMQYAEAQSTGQRTFLWVVFGVVIANYLAQIPYYLHLYYFPHHVPPSLSGSLLLGATLVWFLAGWLLLARGERLLRAGYWLLLSFLLVEVVFYARNMLTQVTHGYPPFMHLQARDPVLWVVFAIGYLNMICGVYFLCHLVRYSSSLVASHPQRR
ncbi:MAG: hypothetical protein ABI068_13955 [Ktedonobacterales bacterium]